MSVTRRSMMGGMAAGLGLGLSGSRVFAQTARLAGPEDLIAAAKLSGKVGYLVANARTGKILEQRDANQQMPPASTLKSITSLYALSTLGPSGRFATRLLATGPVRSGVIQGDLILAGGGDPTLSTDDLADMAAALRAKGVSGVTGRFLVWGGALPYEHEIAGDQPIHVAYNPAVSGLILNSNRVFFEWKRAGNGYQIGMEAKADRNMPTAYTASVAVANRKSPLFTYSEAGGKELWTVAQPALGKAGNRWLPVRHPALYAGDVFQTLARAQGIPLPGPEELKGLPAGDVLVDHGSTGLRDVLKDMLKYSTNLTAEAVGLATSARLGAGGSLAASGRAMSDWLRAQTGATSARFVDHSGLGAESRISAAEMTGALARLGPGVDLRPILRDIAMRDAQGKVVANHPIKVKAKTGTLNFVSTLTGYVTAPGGAEMVFAIFTGDVARREASARSEAPEGSRGWIGRSKRLQQQLIERWSTAYGL
jgi:serine-type D-Ala-D-Ala carboxypeptidase/endopeptidase (penicillin-binding protein 4)